MRQVPSPIQTHLRSRWRLKLPRPARFHAPVRFLAPLLSEHCRIQRQIPGPDFRQKRLPPPKQPSLKRLHLKHAGTGLPLPSHFQPRSRLRKAVMLAPSVSTGPSNLSWSQCISFAHTTKRPKSRKRQSNGKCSPRKAAFWVKKPPKRQRAPQKRLKPDPHSTKQCAQGTMMQPTPDLGHRCCDCWGIV